MIPPKANIRDLIRTSQDPNVDLRNLRRDICAEAALADRVLRYVRLFYRRVADLEDPSRAVAILGPRMSGYIAVQHVLVTSIDTQRMPPSLLASFWSDCIHRAVAARLLAVHLKGLHPDLAFATGLAAEWGVIPMLQRTGLHVDWMRTVRNKVHEERIEAERALFGRNHTNSFVRIGRAWELPPELLTVVGGSHRQSMSGLEGESILVSTAIRWADRLGECITSNTAAQDLQTWVCEAVIEFNITSEEAWQIVERTLHGTPLAAKALGVAVAEQPTLDALRLREKKGPHSLDPTQLIELVNVLQEDNEGARRQVESQIAELQLLRGQDFVTGLASHAGFLQLFRNVFNGARSDGRPLTLLLIDIDGFTEINRHRGHAAGNSVLHAVGRMLAKQAPNIENVARVGCDTFAMFAEVDERKGRLLAERARAAIEAMVVDVEGHRIYTTATVVGLSLEEVPPAGTHELMFGEAWALMAATAGSVRNRTAWKTNDQARQQRNRPTLGGLVR